MPAPKESAIVGHILKWLNAKPGVKAIKQHGDAFSTIGTPDIIACINGRVMASNIGGLTVVLEAKRPGNLPTVAQAAQLLQWAEAGAIAGVVHSVDEVKELLRAHGIALD